MTLSKVKVDLSDAFKDFKSFKDAGIRIIETELKDEIIREISEGRSPVKKAGGRFKKYSVSYSKAIDKGRYSQFNKRKRPVNLRLSGKLLRSIFSRKKNGSTLIIGFNNFLADIHNRQGAGKSRAVRRMLPTERGETFTDSIIFALGVKLRRAAKKFFR